MLFVFILMIGMAYASDDWGDMGSGDGTTDATPDDASNPNDESASTSDPVSDNPVDDGPSNNVLASFFDSERYTSNFYLALGFGGVGILIILLFIYLFIRGPKNKFKKKPVKKKEKKAKKK